MTKVELSKMLEEKMQEKLKEGYVVNTYAMDIASTDKLKRDLKPQSHPIPHDDSQEVEWHGFLREVETGDYVPDRPAPVFVAPPSERQAREGAVESSSSSGGLWKVKRH